MSDIKIVPERLDYELLEFLTEVTAVYCCHLTKTQNICSNANLVWDRILLEMLLKQYTECQNKLAEPLKIGK
jgi:hypothetical protein